MSCCELTGSTESRFRGNGMRKNYTMPSAGHGRSALYAVRSPDVRLARIERVVNSLHKKLEDFRIALEQLVPHLGPLKRSFTSSQSSWVDRAQDSTTSRCVADP